MMILIVILVAVVIPLMVFVQKFWQDGPDNDETKNPTNVENKKRWILSTLIVISIGCLLIGETHIITYYGRILYNIMIDMVFLILAPSSALYYSINLFNSNKLNNPKNKQTYIISMCVVCIIGFVIMLSIYQRSLLGEIATLKSEPYKSTGVIREREIINKYRDRSYYLSINEYKYEVSADWYAKAQIGMQTEYVYDRFNNYAFPINNVNMPTSEIVLLVIASIPLIVLLGMTILGYEVIIQLTLLK